MASTDFPKAFNKMCTDRLSPWPRLIFRKPSTRCAQTGCLRGLDSFSESLQQDVHRQASCQSARGQGSPVPYTSKSRPASSAAVQESQLNDPREKILLHHVVSEGGFLSPSPFLLFIIDSGFIHVRAAQENQICPLHRRLSDLEQRQMPATATHRLQQRAGKLRA